VEKVEVKPRKRYESFAEWAREMMQVWTVPAARFLTRIGLRPNSATLLGALLCVGVSVVLASGRLALGGALFALVCTLDVMDGAMARHLGRKSRFGAFLDSTLDRLSDAAVLGGLAFYFAQRGATLEVMLALASMSGSTLVSYTRARAEALGFSCKIGIVSRLERIVILTAGLVLGFPTIALWVLAIGTHLTALQRIIYVYRQCQRDG